MASRRRTGRALLAAAVVAALLGASACTSPDDGSGSGTSTTSSSTTTTTAVDPGPGPTSLEGVTVRLDPVVSRGLDTPVAMVARPMRNQLWIAERAGRVRIVSLVTEWDRVNGRVKRIGATLLPDVVLDLSSLTSTDGERGLLGLAFATDGRTLYVHHTDREGSVVVASYAVTDTGTTPVNPTSPVDDVPGAPNAVPTARVDAGSRQVLLSIPHADNSNHNGGGLVLGPDGYLYVGVGDGGGSGDPDGNGQSTDTLLGKILRIDPAIPGFTDPYAIPAGNPFADEGGEPEIWLYGVRNPWRFSFDRANGDLWVADVGQDQVEEIDWLPSAYGAGRGANLGWDWFEGDRRFTADGTPPEGMVGPLHTYTHDGGNCSITGGYVYRGSAVPDLEGVYVYGDYCAGELHGLLSRSGIVLDVRGLGAQVPPGTLVSFGEDDQGELYVLSSAGTLSRIVG